MRRSKLLILFICINSFCSNPDPGNGNSTEKNDRREQIRYTQYFSHGKRLYGEYCENCHMQNGQGFVRLYPPLAQSDYLMSNLPRAACIIKNGQEGEIFVDSISFNMKMPGVPELSEIEIAEILTYISNSWGNKAGLVNVQDTREYLKNCTNQGAISD